MLNLTEILLKVLSTNQWGVYYKGEPLEKMNTNEGMTMYRVNEIQVSDILASLEKEIKEHLENNNK